jgi:preprotein translocase subunit SecA
MTPALPLLLPRPGPVWGAHPMRPPQDTTPPRRGLRWPFGGNSPRRLAAAAEAQAMQWQRMTSEQRAAALAALRTGLRRDALAAPYIARALGIVSSCAAETVGWTARPVQYLAALAMLEQRMAEMATGEGKTLAIALAAAVAALAGVPVHVVTANDYLAQRDAQRLAPCFAALGLSVAARPGAEDDPARRAVYAHDIVYATAKDLAFDFLRDRQAARGHSDLERVAAMLGGAPPPAPVMRGLCLALLDEADSILLDEAEVPLILSRGVPQAARRAFLWQALALARQLDGARDFDIAPGDRHAVLTPTGEERLAVLAAPLGGPWQRARYRREAVQVALAGLHAYRRNEQYLVRDGAIEVLDEVTGRVAPGRVWSRGLHTVLAIKEGLSPPDETETVARTTFQRFFQRYWRLGGVSGTLWEARDELHAVYGVRVRRIPLHRPCRRKTLRSRHFNEPDAMFAAAAARAAEFSAAGRPVLLATDSVADSQAMSAELDRLGVAHRVLNALNDAEEAAIVAGAGRAGCVTVATRMAGRGTDIELDDVARQAGGLHALSCQHNPSRRLDRQFAGRAARQGEPGSTEAWICLRKSNQSLAPSRGNLGRCIEWLPAFASARLVSTARRWSQSREERRRTTLRRDLLKQDLEWERRLAFAGPPQ